MTIKSDLADNSSTIRSNMNRFGRLVGDCILDYLNNQLNWINDN